MWYFNMNSGNILIIGISGVTCGGKTTTACELNKIFPNCKIFSQDEYFLNVDDSRHKWIPELNHINFDILSSLDMQKMHEDILGFIKKFKRVSLTKKEHVQQNGGCNDDIRKQAYNKFKELGLQVVIVEGFCIFNYQPMLELFDLKYYFTLEREECFRRRKTRVYEPPDCPGYFEKCVWPEYQQQLKEVKESVDDIMFFSEHTVNHIDTILADILTNV